MSERKIIYPGRSEIKKLGQLMKEKFPEIVNSRVKDLLQQSECPFTTALDVLQKSIYKNSPGWSICKIVSENLEAYNTERSNPSEEVRKKAAAVICDFHKRIRFKIVKAFRLDQLDLLFIKTLAKNHLENNKMENFLAYHTLFKLHDDEITEKVFIPMLATGKNLDAVLKYAGRSENTQKRILKFVGSLICELNSNTSTTEEQELVKKLLSFLETAKKRYPTAYSEVKIQHSEPKPQNNEVKTESSETKNLNSEIELQKNKAKVQNNGVESPNSESNIQNYEEKDQKSNEKPQNSEAAVQNSETKIQKSEAVSVDIMKNSAKVNKKGQSRRFLLHIKYLLKQWENKQVSGSSLESLIFRYVEKYPGLVEKVAHLVENKYDDKNKADLLRQSMQPGSDRTPIWSGEEEIPIGDHELELAIPIENVFLVDSEEKLNDCFEYFKDNEPSDGSLLPIGFDSEWITSTRNVRLVDLALIQFAINDRVYLIDFVYFQRTSKQLLTEFMKYVFRSGAYVILGFGVSEDKRVLKRYFKDALWTADTHMMDFLKSRNSKVFSDRGTDFEYCPNTEKELKGLSKLCYRVLGKSLNKTYQISNWMDRPLNERQIIYAATDAYCLLQIYHKYEEMFKKSPHCETHQNLLELYKRVPKRNNNKKRRKKKKSN